MQIVVAKYNRPLEFALDSLWPVLSGHGEVCSRRRLFFYHRDVIEDERVQNTKCNVVMCLSVRALAY